MALQTVPHNALDIIPVPANSVFCKACCTIHVLRAQLCPAKVLDICGIHKTVFVPHEKSLYPGSHLTPADTECASCVYGSDKKHNKALTRSNSRALRPSLTHQDIVFCVYCWGPASKKCTHLSSCREHSCLYLRSQIDINAKWWLRPSDFACHLCPTGSVMARKAQEWSKELSEPPAEGSFSEDWEIWRDVIVKQIEKCNPGAFQTWQARNEYVSWMDQLGANTILYLRWLSYEGNYPVTIIYAETGTMPRAIQYPLPPPPARMEPPPPYPHSARPSQASFQPPAVPIHMPGSYPTSPNTSGSSTDQSGSTMTSISSVSSVASTPVPRFARPVGLLGAGVPPTPVGGQNQAIQPFATSRPSHIQSLHSQSHSRQPSQVRSPLVQTAHASAAHQPWNSQTALTDFYQMQQHNLAAQQQQQQQQHPQHVPQQSYSAPVAMSQLSQALGQMTISSQPAPTHLPQQSNSAPGYPRHRPGPSPLGFHQKRASNMSEIQTTSRAPPVIPPQPPATPYEVPQLPGPSRRVSFHNQVQHQVGASQYQIPLSPASSLAQSQNLQMPPAPMSSDRPIGHPFAPYTPGPAQPQNTVADSSRSAMVDYMAQLRGMRLPPRAQYGHISSGTLPGSYPLGRPADDDGWETLSNFSSDTESSRSVSGELSYQGIPQTNPMYAAFQAAHAQGHGGQHSSAPAASSYNPYARM